MSFNFGTPTSSTTANPGFGFSAQKPGGGFLTGNTSLGTTTPATGGFTFGASSTPVSQPGLNFGFGTTPAASAQPQTSTSLLSTGTVATSSVPSSLFSTSATPASLSSGLTFATPTTNANPMFSVTTSATTSSLFGQPTTSTALSTPLFGNTQGGGLFGAKPATAVTTVTSTQNKGLGGLDVSINNKGLSQGSNSPMAVKENLLPNELMQTIESFKDFVKVQKGFTSDIARGSARPLDRCAEDISSLMEILTTLTGSVQRDRSTADKLKHDTAKALQNAEIAQRTHDTPAGLQYENNAPLIFFMELAESFEHDLMLFRSQIEATEKHIQAMMAPKTLTPQELTMAMSKLHESLVAVAGKLQGIHLKVQHQKEQYLNFRKYVLKDNTNVFDDVKSNGKINRNLGRITSGPTPFGLGNKSFLSSTVLNSSRPPTYGTPNPLAWGNTATVPNASNITLGTAMKPPTTSLNFNAPVNLTAPLSTSETNSSFQLQKPPIGNKRGKH